MILAALGVGLLTSIAAATYVAAVDRPSLRDPDLVNFQLVDFSGRTYSIESFPRDLVLAIYFGYATCLRACPLALDNIAAAMDSLGAQGASVRPVFRRHGPRNCSAREPAALHADLRSRLPWIDRLA